MRQPSGKKITQKKTAYDWTYRYDGPQPHAPTHLGDRTFSYDDNGNQLGWTHDKNGTRRNITWDEENRIQAIADNGHTMTYTYDASGQRITKRGPQGETGYINQWITLRNGEVGTKHVFAGTARVVSKLVKQDKPNTKRNSSNNNKKNGQGKARIVYEKDQYYYHPDHLGTTSYITHTNGQIYQHLEYFPFGETWVEEHSNKQRTPYLFTAKELDEETGLYYFGARYYDPRTSVWVSPDPLLNKYLPSQRAQNEDLPGNGGVFSSQNIALYAYAHWSPIKMFDPDGRAVYIVGGAWDDVHNKDKSLVRKGAPKFTKNFSGVFESEYKPQYFKHSERSELQSAIKEMVKNDPEEPIVLMGHSWGGASSTQSQRQLSKEGIDVDLLITVDPVSWIRGAKGKMEGSETKWINLYPADRNRTKGGDFVTIFGNAWNKESDADVNVEVDASYEDAHVGIMFEEFDQSVLKNNEVE